MIFVNRRRIIQNSGVIKDPTKYWYIEKYVYGVLKETVEVPLRTSTTFSAIDSGYDDDTFYGWSISSTSTLRTFTNTASYSNTTSNVKNNLDGENTLKIYAIYDCACTLPITTVTHSVGGVNQNYNYCYSVLEDTTITFAGYSYVIGAGIHASYTGPQSIYISITGSQETNFSLNNYQSGLAVGTISDIGAVQYPVKAGDKINFNLPSDYVTTNQGGHETRSYIKLTDDKKSNLYMIEGYGTYRVESHT